ncbi:hypothetical protein [Halomicrobium sp. IBSBa]|nr:hypothetical protein [Halomicrobium sp. IBSBa]
MLGPANRARFARVDAQSPVADCPLPDCPDDSGVRSTTVPS